MATNNSIRLRTQAGASQNINVKIQQEFDTIDFLSLKITQDQAYLNFCSDYGVVAGRVIANDGFGVPNAKLSIFIPLSDEDSEDPIISQIYPYLTPNDVDAQGIRYNLLPALGKSFTILVKIPNDSQGNTYNANDYLPNITPLGSFAENSSWSLVTTVLGPGPFGYTEWQREIVREKAPEVPVGTFPEKFEILNNDSLLEVHDKYYKYTTTTNASGDYMIFGIPVGVQNLHMDVDLSDIGGESLTADDFINAGFPPTLFNGSSFKASNNLGSLPQIETQNISVDIIPFWGDIDQCEIGITRQDFILTKEIKPSALLVFQAFTNGSTWTLSTGCGSIVGGSGSNAANFRDTTQMKALDVTVEAFRSGSGPEEQDNLPPRRFENGNVIYPLTMYEGRKITDEFGNFVTSNDPNIGIPTAGTWRVHAYGTNTDITEIDGTQRDGTALYRIPNTSQEITYVYDLFNRKKQIYTVGNFNDSKPGNDFDRTTLDGETSDPDKLAYPNNTTQQNNRFGAFQDLPTPGGVCFGSLYFLRFRVGGNNEYCEKVATGVLFNEINSSGGGGSSLNYHDLLGANTVLNITDIIYNFNAFNGGLPETSKSHNISEFNSVSQDVYFNDAQGTNDKIDDDVSYIKNNSYPFRSSELPLDQKFGNVSYDLTQSRAVNLNKLDNTLETVINNDSQTNNFGNSGRISKMGWYFFYFGLRRSSNALTQLKKYLNG